MNILITSEALRQRVNCFDIEADRHFCPTTEPANLNDPLRLNLNDTSKSEHPPVWKPPPPPTPNLKCPLILKNPLAFEWPPKAESPPKNMNDPSQSESPLNLNEPKTEQHPKSEWPPKSEWLPKSECKASEYFIPFIPFITHENPFRLNLPQQCDVHFKNRRIIFPLHHNFKGDWNNSVQNCQGKWNHVLDEELFDRTARLIVGSWDQL